MGGSRTAPFVLALLAGCAAPGDIPIQHIIMVDGRGRLVDPTDDSLWRGLIGFRRVRDEVIPVVIDGRERKLRLAQDYYNMVIDELREKSPKQKRRLLVVVHGGLNTQTGSVQRATELVNKILADTEEPYYPIFINWQSGWSSSYWDYLFWLSQGKDGRESTVFGRIRPVLAPFFLLSDVAKAVGRAPLVWVRSAINLFAGSQADERASEERSHPIVRKSRDIHPGVDRRTFWERLEQNATRLLPTGVLVAPIVDAFGTSAWEVMLRRSTMLFHRDKEFEHGSFEGDLARGALTTFFDSLDQEIQSREDYEITLIGHSVGTIVVNEILRRYPDLPVKNIVHMVSACSVRDYQNTVFPYLASHADTHMYHLVVHDDAERNERPWPFPELLPRGSLLVWIDDFLEKPETWLDRRAGRFTNLIACAHLRDRWFDPDLATAEQRIHIRQFDFGGESVDGDPDQHIPKQPQSHGDFFEDYLFWHHSFWTGKN